MRRSGEKCTTVIPAERSCSVISVGPLVVSISTTVGAVFMMASAFRS
ncbi:Uncharacterised protein [Mycobacteroides abscessus subsp. abscessus]|nr:Uncharacterised protein [Mycobacteroides abscessus subsp. abscessus]